MQYLFYVIEFLQWDATHHIFLKLYLRAPPNHFSWGISPNRVPHETEFLVKIAMLMIVFQLSWPYSFAEGGKMTLITNFLVLYNFSKACFFIITHSKFRGCEYLIYYSSLNHSMLNINNYKMCRNLNNERVILTMVLCQQELLLHVLVARMLPYCQELHLHYAL